MQIKLLEMERFNPAPVSINYNDNTSFCNVNTRKCKLTVSLYRRCMHKVTIHIEQAGMRFFRQMSDFRPKKAQMGLCQLSVSVEKKKGGRVGGAII